MIDHITLPVENLNVSKQFYRDALAPIGYEVLVDADFGVGMGRDGKPDFWIRPGESGTAMHVAFASDDRAAVDRFYEAAIAAGGRDNGAPGVRAEYHPTYYGAFVFDPDGNNVEAVCHAQG